MYIPGERNLHPAHFSFSHKKKANRIDERVTAIRAYLTTAQLTLRKWQVNDESEDSHYNRKVYVKVKSFHTVRPCGYEEDLARKGPENIFHSTRQLVVGSEWKAPCYSFIVITASSTQVDGMVITASVFGDQEAFTVNADSSTDFFSFAFWIQEACEEHVDVFSFPCTAKYPCGVGVHKAVVGFHRSLHTASNRFACALGPGLRFRRTRFFRHSKN